jgi:hypothetical protein
MDFGRVLKTVAGFLEEKSFRYAVVGGVALAAYGLPRMTLDLDLVVEARARGDVIQFLESLGYKTLYRSSGYSNHEHDDPTWGSLDFIYVNENTGKELFSSCRSLPGPLGLTMPVPRPEHLVAMKVTAMKNDPGRTFQEMNDIRFLLKLPGVDRGKAESYFDRQGLGDRLDEIKRTL